MWNAARWPAGSSSGWRSCSDWKCRTRALPLPRRPQAAPSPCRGSARRPAPPRALGGYASLAAVGRERPGTSRVVFTTVHGTEEEQLRGLEAGALDYLVKPISRRVALEKSKRWVGGGRGGR